MKKLDIGAVTAYAMAVKKGYEGTEEEFAAMLAESGNNALRAENAADRAQQVLDSIPMDFQEVSQGVATLTEEKIAKLDGIIPKEQTENLIILASLIDGKYYDDNGDLQPVSTWWYAPLMPIEPNTTYDAGMCAIATYDAAGNFLTRYGDLWGGKHFTTDDGAAFVGVCSNQDKGAAYLYKQTNNPGVVVPGEKLLSIEQVKGLPAALEYSTNKKIVTVGSNRCDYDNICRAIKENQTDTVFVLSDETFDVLAAYKYVYGDDFWANYTRYSEHDDVMYRGLNLGIGCELIGGTNTTLIFKPDNSNSEVTNFFSVLSLTDNNRVSGITFDYSPYLRYAIHDDYSTIGSTTNIVENCIFLGKNADPGRPAIGSGMGTSGVFIYRNNVFTQESRAIGIHNHEGDALGKVVIAGNYSIGSCYIFHYGRATQKTPCIVTGNKFSSINLAWAAQDAYPNENMELFAWNNEVN